MVEEVSSEKKDFKQKENKYLEEFLDMKALKEKVEDKLYKQDQSLQTVHMLCKPKPYYDEQNKVAIGYKNPLCLTRAKQVQPALYNGHEIIKTNHVPAIVHNSEDTLEIAEITRKKMNDKMKDPKFIEMHDAYTVVQARCLEIEAELSKLRDKIQTDDHNELVNRFSNVEHLKESVETIREIVEEAKVERPLDRSLAYACLYTKHSQELLVYVIGTCSKDFNQRDKNYANTPLTEKKQVTFEVQCGTSVQIVSLVRIWDSAAQTYEQRIAHRLRNFVKNFIGTVRFGNDHFGAIRGYRDYVIGDSNCALVEAAKTMLIFSKASMFLWTEAMANACYTQNRSLIHTLHNKTPYELVHDKKPDLTFFCVFGALCYPPNDNLKI
ncbi:retrovirus-related pol polyprotein from transposon TNT 1-94 [Tanacetum coccineum]